MKNVQIVVGSCPKGGSGQGRIDIELGKTEEDDCKRGRGGGTNPDDNWG